MEDYKKDTNGVMFKHEGTLQLFLLDDKHKVIDIPSIQLGETEDGTYADMEDNYLQFVEVKVKKRDDSDGKIVVHNDFVKKYDYVTRNLGGIEIKRRDDKLPAVIQIMKEGLLQDFIDLYFTEDAEESVDN